MNYSLILTIVIALMQVLIVSIPLSGKLSDNRRSLLKKLTKRGWALIISCSIVAIITIFLFVLSESKEEQNEKTLQLQLQHRDSIHQKIVADAALKYIEKLDKSSLETAKALAKYGLKYDQTKQEIFKAVSTDTLKPALDPEIFIANNKGIEIDTILSEHYSFSIKLVNKIAPAKNVKLSLYFISLKENYLRLLNLGKPYKIYAQGSDMNFEASSTSKVDVPNAKDDFMFFYLVGTFENTKRKLYKVQRVYSYNFKLKQFGTPTDLVYPDIIGLLKRNNLYIEVD